MKKETYRTLQAMIAQDPLTDAQLAELTGADGDVLIDNKRAAEMLGVSEQTMRTVRIKKVRVNRFLRYKLRDVRTYRDEHMSY